MPNLRRIRKRLRGQYLEDVEASREFSAKEAKKSRLGSIQLEGRRQTGQTGRQRIAARSAETVANIQRTGGLERTKVSYGTESGLPQSRRARTQIERRNVGVAEGGLGLKKEEFKSREKAFTYLRGLLGPGSQVKGISKPGAKTLSPEEREATLNNLFDTLLYQ